MKEKIINYIEALEAKSLQVDDYFKQRNELYISNQEKDKEIERLNNIINELEEWLEQEYAIVRANSIEEPNNPEWYIKWNERKIVLDKIKELKGE